MADLVVIVPSRGRPHAVAEVVAAFSETCTASTILMFACDRDDPAIGEYHFEVQRLAVLSSVDGGTFVTIDVQDGGSMVSALNHAASTCLKVEAIAFMGDDHRPRTKGWDTAYLEALAAKPGMVFGNDRIQGMKLPTQIAMSASLVRALGHMAPPVLKHMYVDNYWLQLGLSADCITYLPDVTVEHLHPSAGTAEIDEGYLRVNAREVFDHDEKALAAYWTEHAERDIAAARQVLVA
jgi:hypothetical protein